MITVFSLTLLYFLAHVMLHSCRGQWNSRNSQIIVDTQKGRLIGIRDKNIVSFLGIPYAEPPVGKFRFRPSRSRRPWFPNELKAFNYSAECLQSGLYFGEGSKADEDCLYLNIWYPYTPKASKPLPVLVWIYGGAFLHGAASRPEYIGDRLAMRDVIVVTFNYRVGALGFLVSIADQLFGNYGLHDQKLALQWVQDNIHLFNGDPNRVTLFGESAGSMSALLHWLDQQHPSNRNYHKPLFQGLILQSNPLGYKYRSIAVANFIGAAYKELLDCEDLKCLQSESADELLHVQDTLMAVPRSIGDFFTWGPVVTDNMYYREIKLRPAPVSNMTVQQPLEAIKNIRMLPVNTPIMMGTNSHEGIVFVYTAFPTRMFKTIFKLLVVSFFRESAPKVLDMYAYLTKQVDSSPVPDYRVVLSKIIGDYLFRCPNQLFSSSMTKLGSQVFLYEFALPSRIPYFSCCDGLACHTSELPYVFDQIDVIAKDYSYLGRVLNSSIAEPESRSWYMKIKNLYSKLVSDGYGSNSLEVDASVAKLMGDYWSTFAKFFNPNGLLGVNGVIYGTRPNNAPWWPLLFGQLPSEKAYLEMQCTTQQRNAWLKEKRQRFDQLVWDESYRTFVNLEMTDDIMRGLQRIEKVQIDKSMRKSQLSDQSQVHFMKFSEYSSAHVLDSDDCICEAWNKLDYKF